MRSRIRPHALSEHAALAALTSLERGRLNHIALSIPPEHSPAPELPAAIGLRGRPLLRRWVVVVAAAETLGFVAPAIVGASTSSAPASVAVPALIAAGLIEGTALGIGQALVLRRAIPNLSTLQWVLATAVGAMLAYALAMLPASLVKASEWSPAATLAGAAVLGALILMTIGGTQWVVLRRHVDHAHRWIWISAVAWLLGLAVFVGVSTPLWQEGQSLILTIGIGIFGGLVMAGVTAWLTGVGMVSMLASRTKSSDLEPLSE